MRVQYCDHYLPVNSADPSLKNFRAAIVVLRWTCYVWSGSFSSALFSVTMSRDKYHAAHFSCVTKSHDKNLAVCARLAEIALLSKRYNISAIYCFAMSCFIEAKCRRCFHIGEYKKNCQIQQALLQ